MKSASIKKLIHQHFMTEDWADLNVEQVLFEDNRYLQSFDLRPVNVTFLYHLLERALAPFSDTGCSLLEFLENAINQRKLPYPEFAACYRNLSYLRDHQEKIDELYTLHVLRSHLRNQFELVRSALAVKYGAQFVRNASDHIEEVYEHFVATLSQKPVNSGSIQVVRNYLTADRIEQAILKRVA